MVGVGMRGDHDVQALDTERGELRRDLLLIRPTVDQHDHTGGRRHECGIALPHIEEPHDQR